MLLEPKPTLLPMPTFPTNVRVGLVLPQDRAATINIGRATVTVCGNNQVKVSGAAAGETKLLFSGTEPMAISPVVAGRGFHWQATHRFAYTGQIEVTACNGSLTVVNILPFEDYVAAVVASEMSHTAPPEFIKAQAVAARSWAYVSLKNKHPGESFEICNDDCCQRYQGYNKDKAAAFKIAQTTAGEFLTYGNKVITAYYSKCCGGVGESYVNIFNSDIELAQPLLDTADNQELVLDRDSLFKITSLQGCYCELPAGTNLGEVDLLSSNPQNYFNWSYEITSEQILANLARAGITVTGSMILELTPIRRSWSGRITSLNCVTERESLNLNNQLQIRQILHTSCLYSSAFWVEGVATRKSFILHGRGWGHGVGLCQIGGVHRALAGQDYRTILAHYYPKATIGARAKINLTNSTQI